LHNMMDNGVYATGVGCRFDFPKKLMKQTTVAVLQVSDSQMEARLQLRRTDDRVNNLNELIAYYWRANHDIQVSVQLISQLTATSGRSRGPWPR
jgi:hypothetical protein